MDEQPRRDPAQRGRLRLVRPRQPGAAGQGAVREAAAVVLARVQAVAGRVPVPAGLVAAPAAAVVRVEAPAEEPVELDGRPAAVS